MRKSVGVRKIIFRKVRKMTFAERLKQRRTEAGLTQKELAEKSNVTDKTIQNYELGRRRPVNMEVIQRIAVVLNTTADYLLGSEGMIVSDAHEKGGAKAAREVDEIISEVSALFAGGSLSDEEKEGVMAALNRAYWDAKETNKKYTPKKYRK